MIEQLARELGLALAKSTEFLHMKDAQATLEGDEVVANALNELNEKRARLVAVFSEEPCDNIEAMQLTDDIERLEGQLRENPVMIEMMMAQNAFSQLIRAVNEEINACIGVIRTPESCSGNCNGCSGCRN